MAKKKKWKKRLGKALMAGAALAGGLALARRGKSTPYRNVHDTGAVAMTPGRERWGPGVGGEQHIPRVKKPVWTGDQTMTSDWPFKMMKKGGRVTGIAKRGFGRALKKGRK
jgi:hypothetical protein